MPIFRQKLIWALLILAMISAGGVTAAAPATSPAPAASHAKKEVPPPPATSTTPGTSPAPAMSPGPDCMTLIYNMSDCLTYVEQGSNATKPDKNCCPELAGMLDSKPECLCNLLGKGGDFQLDLNRALKLPSICGLQTPPISMCSMIGIPVAAPGAGVSAEAPSSTPGMSTSPSPMGGAEGPSGSGGKNGVPTLNSYSNLSYLIYALALAVLTL